MEILIPIFLLGLIIAWLAIDFLVKTILQNKYRLIYSVIAFVIVVPLALITLAYWLFDALSDVRFLGDS